MKKSTKQISLIAILLIGILLITSPLLLMAARIKPNEYYTYYEGANFLLICMIFAFVFSRIERDIRQGVFKLLAAFGVSIWSYYVILIEKSIMAYSISSIGHSKENGMIDGLLNSLEKCANNSSWIYIQFAILTMLFCTLYLVFPKIIKSEQEKSEKRTKVQLLLKIMFTINIVLKIVVFYNAKNPFLYIWYFTDLEIISYILDGLIFMSLFALLNRRSEKICYKLIYAAIISSTFITLLVEENLTFLYNRNWREYADEASPTESFFAEKGREYFKSVSFYFGLIYLLFFALCIAHILMKKYRVLEKLKVSLKKIANHFIIDDSVYEIAFDVEAGKIISGKIKEISSVKIGENRITTGLLTYDDGHQKYVCFKSVGASKNEIVSICSNQQKVLEDYSKQIIFFSNINENIIINGDLND